MEEEKSESSDPPPNNFSELYALCVAKFGASVTDNYSHRDSLSSPVTDISESLCQLIVDRETVSIRLIKTYNITTQEVYGLWVEVCNGKKLIQARTIEQFFRQLGNKSEPILIELSRQLGLEKRVENT